MLIYVGMYSILYYVVSMQNSICQQNISFDKVRRPPRFDKEFSRLRYLKQLINAKLGMPPDGGFGGNVGALLNVCIF